MTEVAGAPGAPLALERLRAMPKVELHCHLDGSLRPETMMELARASGITLPVETPEELRTYMRADHTGSLEAYLSKFAMTITLLQNETALERVAFELVEDAARDGVRYIEIRYAPHLNIAQGLSLDAVLEATLRGLQRGEREFGISARLIVCALRQWPACQSLEAAQAAVRFQHDGVVAFDLAGAEFGYSAATHADAFLYARSHDLNVTCHAGEADGAQSMREALYICGAYRIGHGVRLDDDSELFHHVRDRQIPLEFCPTSNVQTHAVSSYADHPIRRFYDDGLVVTINTDNRLISGVTLTDEFYHLTCALDFSEQELASCVLMACDSAFLPLDERRVLRHSVAQELKDGGYV